MTSERLFNSFIPLPPKKNFYTPPPKKNFWLRPWSAVASHTRAASYPTTVSLDVANTVGHSIVSSRLDYTNALLHGTCTSTSNLHRLQVAQNSLARAVCQAPRSVSTTELRRQLYWLPVRQRIGYKLPSSPTGWAKKRGHSSCCRISRKLPKINT